MSRLPPRPDLSWTEDGKPHSAAYDDIYFSGDGLSETRAVFLDGCGLPGAWAGREHFCVGELGFGSGLNILALWELWRAHRPSTTARLNVISFEGFLMRAEDAARVHASHPALVDLSAQLLAQWPERARGVQRIELGDGVTLTLHVDDITRALPEAEARVDAWLLDGFAPAKNAEMWSESAMREIARLSAPGARLATYTVAGAVRRSLEAAGFSVEKLPGHGRKKERLEARLGGQPENAKAPRKIVIVGAGIAGAWAARAFVTRGCDVNILDQGASLASGASGNPLALVMPRLDAADGPAARALIEAYLVARRGYLHLDQDAAAPLDVVQRARTEGDHRRFAKLAADPPLEHALLAGDAEALLHRGAIAVQPALAIKALTTGATFDPDRRVRDVGETSDAAFATLDTGETRLADLVIVCAGWQAGAIAGIGVPAITPRLGQIERSASQGTRAIADGGYCLEALGHLVFGATFEALSGDPSPSDAARTENLATLARLRPDLDPSKLSLTSRAGVRATTQDRLPFAGRPVGADARSRLHVIGGLGSRGFLWAPLLAEIVASEVFGEPLPVEASVRHSLSPSRFAERALRRGA
jgi:tRNA 5-methylaminomethyl-2-thiouridine biosynthesis bifunctional protein